uniref:RRM domain-containing protein n=1 Tax=Chenopodium quinoa TaxID=63459 RepID=A0A803NB38_CHEQI
MRTRNANTPKTPASQKKPPSAKKSAVKTPTPPSLPVDSTPETSTPKSTASRNPEPQTTPSTADLNPEPAGEAGDSNVDVTDSTDAKAVNLSKSEEFVMKDLKLEELVTDKVPDGGEPQDKGKEKMDGIESPVVAIEDVSSAGNEDTSEPKEDKDDESKQDEAADPDKQAKDNLEKLVRDKSDSMDDDQKKENVNVHDMLKNRDSDKMDKTDEQAAESKQDEACATGGIEEYGTGSGAQELAAAAKERKVKKELEIFVGGLDREVIEDDVKKTFEKVGEVVEVRLLKDTLTNKNRGFAFVRFATKDQAKRALSEMKNPVIRGKRCGTAPNEDNDTLFLGNVCNTWTKEAIKQKLKDYSVEGVENITLVQDPRHEGLSRGFCFIQFACHADAMFAYKRLQKPDAIFGHTERTAKVAFAEPLQEPDPEVMAKTKVRARLSNPLPKTQAVKGGMCGGFRIGRPSGRSFGRAAPALNRPNFQYGRPSRGQFNEPVGPYGRRVPYRAGHMAPGVGPAGRPNFGGPRDIGRGLARPVPSRREPFQLDDGGYSKTLYG